MSPADRDDLVARLKLAFGNAVDVTPSDEQPLHVLLPELALPEPWQPSPARVLTIWSNWPTERPQFVIDESVVGENGEPPRSHNPIYALGETWRAFSFAFPWSSTDPVRAVQLWMARFTVERS